jgi:hypothetical protein
MLLIAFRDGVIAGTVECDAYRRTAHADTGSVTVAATLRRALSDHAMACVRALVHDRRLTWRAGSARIPVIRIDMTGDHLLVTY